MAGGNRGSSKAWDRRGEEGRGLCSRATKVKLTFWQLEASGNATVIHDEPEEGPSLYGPTFDDGLTRTLTWRENLTIDACMSDALF